MYSIKSPISHNIPHYKMGVENTSALRAIGTGGRSQWEGGGGDYAHHITTPYPLEFSDFLMALLENQVICLQINFSLWDPSDSIQTKGPPDFNRAALSHWFKGYIQLTFY